MSFKIKIYFQVIPPPQKNFYLRLLGGSRVRKAQNKIESLIIDNTQ